MSEVLLNTVEAATVLGMKKGTVQKLVAKRAFPRAGKYMGSRRLGNRIPSGDIEAYAGTFGEEQRQIVAGRILELRALNPDLEEINP